MTSESNVSTLLEEDVFRQIVAKTPLISVDLIVRNKQEQVLLGLRLNRPAQGYWFVPGGRIRKDERIEAAFRRLTITELGCAYVIDNARFLGVYEHFYDDNFYDKNFTTHYVVLGYEILIQENELNLPKEQHAKYRWNTIEQIISDPSVHDNTKLYFKYPYNG